jgi:hypothetical protein
MSHRDLKPNSELAWTKALLRQPPGQWPKDFEGFASIARAFQELFHEASQSVPSQPHFTHDRGIVICGGGWRFFPSIYVTVRVIRHIGCTLPIQIWYLGDRREFDKRMAECLKDYGVGWICANSAWRERPEMRIRRLNIDNGWMLKPFAAAYCPFAEVISLDADCYPVYNPERFLANPEYRRIGAAFWPDKQPLGISQYERFGVMMSPDKCVGLESGQYIVDKRKHWKPLWLTCFLNAYHEYVYKHMYGDKDTFNVAWKKAGHEMCIPQKDFIWDVHSFIHKDFDNKPLWVHRTQDKFRMIGNIDGHRIPDHYQTRQQGSSGNVKNMNLPHEEFAHRCAAECDRLLRPSCIPHLNLSTT